MIEKIKNIKNLAVFNDFDWDKEVVDSDNNIRSFKKINIIYGRNYSGKTTLSRIIRAMETGNISDKYNNPECCVKVKDNVDITQVDFLAHNKTIRVFNEDFIRYNLNFIINPDENILPFAILGGDNNKIEEDIKVLSEKLGSNIENEETNLYKDLKASETLFRTAKSAHSSAINSLERQIRSKAIDNPNGIKYQSEKFGDQNYTTTKLKQEINKVITKDFKAISDEETKQAEDILSEQTKVQISELPNLKLKFNEISETAKQLITRKIGRSNKIQELVRNAVLNRWVEEGKELHEKKREICAFCNNEIKKERWEELDKHFDEESDKLKKDISNLLEIIRVEIEEIEKIKDFNKDGFYKEFHTRVERLSEKYTSIITLYNDALKKIEKQLTTRKNDILNEKIFQQPDNYLGQIETTRTEFEELRIKSNDYSETLGIKQKKAKINLRFREIYDFVNDIKFNDLTKDLHTLQMKEEMARKDREGKQKEIDEILAQIDSKQKQLKDESKGADQVNEYLNNYFGHSYLSLKAIEFEEEYSGDKKYKFEIQRDNKKAYHLSGGECSLIAFCYFMAKLQDINTKLKKPIIWIDDPISSLDSNHIFFIYTLIKTKIFEDNDFAQLFISTHNLEFLKFMKRLPGANITKETKSEYRYLIVERNDKISTMKPMPDYLREYVTEFNYLFNQIYQCANIEKVDDKNYTLFYNFGNNARKFLDIFLYYKYPDSTNQFEKMKMFFEDDSIPAVLTNRLSNEYSHLCGIFERGATVIEVPEMKTVAEKIIEKLKEDDKQYSALLRSINEAPTENGK